MAVPMYAQVNIFCGQDTISASQATYSASIQVADFEGIVGTQFSFVWDPAVLTYEDISNINSNFSLNDHFGIDKVADGIIRFVWFDAALKGISIADSTTVFSVDFAVVGNAGATSALAFSDEPIEREVTDTTFEVATSEFRDGLVFLDVTSNIRTQPDELNISSIQPNPVVSMDPIIKFYIKKTDTLTLRVVTMDGRELHRSLQSVNAGQQQLRLDRSIFDQAGIYLITLQSEQFISTHKLMVQE